MELRYVGFDQLQNTRAYRFNCVEKGEPTVELVITANIELFSKHHVGIQEGPSLCALKLTSDLASLQKGAHELTNEDLLTYISARSAAEARKMELRMSRRRIGHGN